MGEFPAERAPCAPWTRFRCTRVHARTYSDIQMMVHKVHNAPPGAGVGGLKVWNFAALTGRPAAEVSSQNF